MSNPKEQYPSVLERANPIYAYVNAFVDELQRSHVHNVVICPGSRSTPLAMAFAAHSAFHIWMHVDERSAAFFALGMAKGLEQPVALLCTSGTAAANFFPAVVEANLTHIPLVILTADRPHELRDCGAPQAIDQNRLYGTHVKWFVEVALPEATNAALRYIRTIANRAVARVQAVPAGPVHLNMPFREPLVPELLADQADQDQEDDARSPLRQGQDTLAWQGRTDGLPYIEVDDAALASATRATIQRLASALSTRRHGLIIVGTNSNLALIEPLLQLAQRLGYPILADSLSQFRAGPHDHSPILTSYDAFLRSNTFVEQMEPEVVLRFGPMPISKPLLLYLKHYAHCPQIVVDAQDGWDEPTQLASEMIHTDPVVLCRDLLTALPATNLRGQLWFSAWLRSDRITRQALHSAMQDFPQPFEGRVFVELTELLPAGSTLFAGNSMPVRDMDTFFWGNERRIRVLGNRGANGIDGIVSSALGVSAVSTQGEDTVLVIGDLSFFHDLNGLLAARLHSLNITIVLVNNDGGGIFSFLPQSAYPQHFEQLFGTPTGLDFQAVVEMYGGHFQRIHDWHAFRRGIEQSFRTGGLHVIEVTTERQSNVTMHRHLWHAVENALHESFHIQRLAVNGVNLSVLEYGNKGTTRRQGKPAATLVLLHGFTGSAIGWGHVIEDLATIGLSIVALDMPGHGESDAPLDPGRYSIEHCQEDILAVLQALGIERGEAILLGYSMGGRIALYCAFSGYFRALILESASPGLATPTERQQRQASDEALATRIERYGVEAFIDYWEKIPLFASQQRLSIKQREELRVQRLSNRAAGLANSLRGVGTGAQPELYTRLPTLNLPVLLLAGELDSKFCTIARQMASQLPQARLQIIPEAGHTIHLEQPEVFVASVDEFCAMVV